ncbi:hypothetical protein L6R52_42105, partial [Myxococcota bacterium]|nr:hypothetical protein [Myxococcota bacterium]
SGSVASEPPALGTSEDASPWSGAAVAARLGPRSEERASPFAEARLFAQVPTRDVFLELDDAVSELDITQVQPAVARRWTAGAVLALLSAAGLFAFFLASR